ncbi:hypothetical protein K492DRAFT_206181 [Lichtheimia hyalospora FSU 10163]|nr:hypothetical protein K492DRAFT_206181 [Lichtheimia hyalospora FSU 10163]
MYDFHKVPDCDPSVDGVSSAKSLVCDFKHLFFHRDRFDELYKIKRKPTRDQRSYHFHYVNIDCAPDDTTLYDPPLQERRQLTVDSNLLGLLDQRAQQVDSAMRQMSNELKNMRASLLQRNRILDDMVDTLETIRDSRQWREQHEGTKDDALADNPMYLWQQNGRV